MLLAHEVRYGNLIEFEGHPAQVYGVDGFFITVCFYNAQGDPVKQERPSISFNPIPLTSDILEAAGCEHYLNDLCPHIPHMITSIEDWHDKLILRVCDSFISVFNFSKCDGKSHQHVARIKYLHQLQNLHFALTGQELEVKIPVKA